MLEEPRGEKEIRKNKNLFESTYVAFKGFLMVFHNETSVKMICASYLLAMAIGFFLSLSLMKMFFLATLWLLVLVLEINNTALEEDIDFTGDGKYHIEIKRVKDYAASTVFLTSSFAIICSLILFIVR